jgi:uncharacterized membrane protein YhaH (DUF805 family)
MDFGEAVSTCFRKYAVMSGRASRSEFWFFHLFIVLLLMAISVFAGVVSVFFGDDRGGNPAAAFGEGLAGVLILLVLFGFFIPHLCVTVRRLHDTNSSGLWYLIFFVPYIGTLAWIVWCCVSGTRGDNKYGPAPFSKAQLEDVFR